MCSMIGLLQTGTRGLGRLEVTGRSLEPSPPAITTAFTAAYYEPVAFDRSGKDCTCGGCRDSTDALTIHEGAGWFVPAAQPHAYRGAGTMQPAPSGMFAFGGGNLNI